MTEVDRHVLAAVDGTPDSGAAVRWAAARAERAGLPLRLAHAWGHPEHAVPGLPGISEVRGRALAALAEAAALVVREHPSVEVRTELLEVPAPRGLLTAAEDAELVVVGSHRPGGLLGLLFGSVGLAVAAGADRPVVLVPAAAGGPAVGGRVVVGVNPEGSPGPVLAFAAREAEHWAASVHAVYAWTPPRGWEALEDCARAGTARRELARLHDVVRRSAGGPVAEEARPGRAAEVLLSGGADVRLLVLGRSRGRLGPVAREVYEHAHTPVAVVPHG
ncbi:universal stress protein [Kitasatospora sp. NPDC002227]|uniref:universal stress protein n=1 Tax=Kitasatospora sp. NPDC002227 TaxID=3154773 RepID=UPI0033205FBC